MSNLYLYYIWCDDGGIIGSSKVLIMVSNNLTTNHPSWLFFPSLPHWQARANTLHLNSYLFVLGCVCMFYLYLCFYFDLYLAENCRELAKSPKVTGQGFPLTEPCDQLVFMATSPLLAKPWRRSLFSLGAYLYFWNILLCTLNKTSKTNHCWQTDCEFIHRLDFDCLLCFLAK